MIEIYLLEQLEAFTKYGTLSLAAEHLNITQPSLSRSMRKLEDILGITLFERQKNRIILNKTGKLAAEHARRILEDEEEMIRHIRAYDRSLHTLVVGSCAPGPLMKFLPSATGIFSHLTVSSIVDTEENLMNGLKNSEYGIIILPYPLETEEFCCQKYISEQLNVSVNPMHPAASYQQISFAEMDGQNFIMYAHVGFWEDIVREKMPHAVFFKQETMDAVGELAKYSDLPSFSSDITLEVNASRQNDRINIPFSDPESRVDFYLICLKSEYHKWKPLF